MVHRVVPAGDSNNKYNTILATLGSLLGFPPEPIQYDFSKLSP